MSRRSQFAGVPHEQAAAQETFYNPVPSPTVERNDAYRGSVYAMRTAEKATKCL